MDFAFLDFLNLDEMIERYSGSSDPRLKVAVIKDLIDEKIKISEVVDPETLRTLDQNMLYRQKVVDLPDK